MIDLNKKRAAIIAIILVIIVFVSITVIVPMAMSSTLTWSVRLGDKASYHVTVDAWQLNASYVVPPPSRYAILDGVNVSTEIVALPELGWFLNGGDFAERVIRTDKVNVTFQNGSAIPDDISVRLKSMLSSCMLPTGSWSLIDIFYPDSHTAGPGADIYWSYSGTSSFHFGHYGSGIDSIRQMSSTVSYETGLPSVVSYHYRHGVDSELNLTLLQI
ncbi:MAG: hypothetical protein ACXADS_14205 [Candidatus Thorarchaeota archaeon]